MNVSGNKPDLVELARAQLDFAAVNQTAPAAREILFKAQTLVPMAPHTPWERYATAAGGMLVLAALLCLPWVPQQQRYSVAGLQFDSILEPKEAQKLINHGVREINQSGQPLLLSASLTSGKGGAGLLVIRAAAAGARAAELRESLSAAYAGLEGRPQMADFAISELEQHVQMSPAELFLRSLRRSQQTVDSPVAGYANLASELQDSEALLRRELAAELLQYGMVLTGFAFCRDSSYLPTGCQFAVEAYPAQVAVGVRGYFKMAAYQQREVRQRVDNWLLRMNLKTSGLVLEQASTQQVLQVQVLDREGRLDQALSAQLSSYIDEGRLISAGDLLSEIDRQLSVGAEATLPGYERQVQIERRSRLGEQPRYLARIRIGGRQSAAVLGRPADPVDDSSVREEW